MTALDPSIAALLASSDVDAMRQRLQALAAPAAPLDEDDDEDDSAPDPVAALTERAAGIADHLLKLGLPHLEREAAAADAATASTPAAQWPLMEVPELGLMLRAQPVMGQAVWPAALALGKFLREHAHLCDGARVVELGAGGAAPGLVARAQGAAYLLATDGDESLVQLMAANCEANAGGDWSAAMLDWRDVEAVAREASGSWDLVLAADVLYTAGDLVPVARASRVMLRSESRSRVLLACSAWFEGFQPTLVAAFEEEGFVLLSQWASGRGSSAAAEGGAAAATSSVSLSAALDATDSAAVVLEFGLKP